MEKKIFISYSSKDVAIANQMVEYLEANGCVCWIAPRNITSGHDYTDMINDAINDCNGLVMIMSDNSVKSQWVKKELSTAVSYNKTIIPFKITNVNLTGGLQFMLNNVQWIDATSNPARMFPQVIKGLGGEGTAAPVVPTESESSGNKKMLWIIIAGVVVAAIVAVVLLIPSSSKQPEEALPTTPDTIVIEKTIDSLTSVPQPTEDISNKATTEKKSENSKTKEKKEKEKRNTKVEEVSGPVESPKVEEKKAEATVSTHHVEETPAPKPVVMPDEQPSTTVDLSSQPAKSTSSPKLRKAKTLWGQKKYKEALKLFQELKKTDPTNPEIDRFISDCRSHL